MLTQDFAQRTRVRIAEARAALTKLRDVGKETVRQLTRIDKQHTADRTRFYEALGKLADGVFDVLPDEEGEVSPEWERASALQDRVNDLAADVDEVSIISDVETLGSVLDEITGFYARLKEAEAQLSKVERLGTKLGI